MNGLHLTADLRGCDPAQPLMREPEALRALCLQAVRDAGLQAVGELFHRFPPPGGITGVVLLAESHLAVHTWPELGAVTLDVYVCNASGERSERGEQGEQGCRAEALAAALETAFAPGTCSRQRLQRG